MEKNVYELWLEHNCESSFYDNELAAIMQLWDYYISGCVDGECSAEEILDCWQELKRTKGIVFFGGIIEHQLQEYELQTK